MTQTADILDGFDADILGKGVIFGIDPAGEDEILPDENAVAVAQVVEAILLVEPAAPHAQHVHVRRGGVTDQPSIRSSLMRVGKESAGIQSAPLAKIGTPLTTNVKDSPH